MSAPDNNHMLLELQNARARIEKLERMFDDFYCLVIENTAISLNGETYWPDWLVNKLSEMGLYVRKEKTNE